MVSFALLLTALATLAAASPASKWTLTRREAGCDCTRASIAFHGLDCQEVPVLIGGVWEDCHFCCHPLDMQTTAEDCAGECHEAHGELECPANYEPYHCGIH